MEIDFTVQPAVPVKTDSIADNHQHQPSRAIIFLASFREQWPRRRHPSGYTLKSNEYTSFADVTALIAQLGPNANELLGNLNDRVVALKDTIDRVNDLLDAQNRANISESLADLHGMLDENRPAIHSTLNNVNASSAKLGP